MQGQSLAAVFLMAASLAAGGTPPKAELHDLKAVTPKPSKPLPATTFTVSVGPVKLPNAVDRPELVLTVAAGKVEVQDLHRWSHPLADEIARVVAENLVQILGPDRVWLQQKSSKEADYRVEIDVLRFDSLPGQWVAFDARWTLRRGPEGAKQATRSIIRKAVHAPGVNGIVAAHSDALDVMSREIVEILLTMDKEPH